MKKTLLALSATLALALGGTTQAQENTATQTLRTGHLRGIDAHSGFDVTLTQGPASKAVISVDSRLRPYLHATVDDGVLNIGFNNLPHDLQRVKGRKAEVTVSSLQKLEVHSGAKVTGNGSFTAGECEIDVHSGAQVSGIDIAAKEIEIDVHSSARATITGTTDKLEAETHSGATADLSGLKALDATVSASSGSSLGCWATGSLNAKASSGASIRYHGNPTHLTTNNSSGGSTRQAK